MDQPLQNPDATYFISGRSLVNQGTRMAGVAVTTETEIVWASALPPRTSAQKAELIALTQALRLGKNKSINRQSVCLCYHSDTWGYIP